jgi:NTE family protein
MNRKRIAIACQGGGSQCAFVAGALGTLFAERIQERFRVVGLSGTSGGAITAALGWVGLLAQGRGDETPIEQRIRACWEDLTAQTPVEIFLDGSLAQLLRLAESGYLPTVASSPSSPQFRAWSEAVAMLVARPEFTDLRALITKHIDFDRLPSLLTDDSPVLLVGAGDVLKGSFKVFSSARGEISIEALLASAAIPDLFPAVWVDRHAYWDGIFATNPPVVAFLREPLVGRGRLPEEIWIIQVNPVEHEYVPESPDDISDRRNHLAGNLSLLHELQLIDLMNTLVQEGAFTSRVRTRFGLDTSHVITVRFIRMSRDLERSLDYPSKLSRLPGHISRLIADGEAQAKVFLAELAKEVLVDQALPGGPADAAEQLLEQKA